ncbi:MAG: hypothetical protein Q4C95_11540 [Planctomycetia bacterium]|nr:hypothetical protein [Planctomycetia bacterium]
MLYVIFEVGIVLKQLQYDFTQLIIEQYFIMDLKPCLNRCHNEFENIYSHNGNINIQSDSFDQGIKAELTPDEATKS